MFETIILRFTIDHLRATSVTMAGAKASGIWGMESNIMTNEREIVMPQDLKGWKDYFRERIEEARCTVMSDDDRDELIAFVEARG